MTHRITNVLHSAVLIVVLALQAGGVGYLLGGAAGLVVALFLGAVLAMGASGASPRMALWLLGGRVLHPAEAPQLYGLLQALSARAGLSRAPALALIDSDLSNALTFGTPEQPMIGVTRGILRRLGHRELAGVLAHEIGHVVQRDLHVMAIADAFARITRLAGRMGLPLVVFSVLFGQPQLAWVGVVLSVGPVAATLVQLALSRRRELGADDVAIELTRDPAGLASALQRIETHASSLRRFSGLPGRDPTPSALRSHPATTERLKRLRRAAANL